MKIYFINKNFHLGFNNLFKLPYSFFRNQFWTLLSEKLHCTVSQVLERSWPHFGQMVQRLCIVFFVTPGCTPFSWRQVGYSLWGYIANNLKTFLIFDDSPEISYQSKLCNFPKILIELNCEGLGKLQMIIFKSTRL